MTTTKSAESTTISYKDKGMPKNHKYQIFSIFICLYMYMAIYQIANTADDYAKLFKVPKEEIDLFISKIDTYRTVFIILGSTIANFLNGFLADVSSYFATVSYIILFMVRFAYLVAIYMPFTTATNMLWMMSLEGFVFGFLQICIFAVFPHHTSIILLSNDISRIFVFVCQTLLCLTDIRSIEMIKWLWYISIVMGIIGLGMVCHYIFDNEGPFADDIECNYKEVMDEKNVELSSYKKFDRIFSPFMMCIVAIFIKEFLYAGVIPFGLLEAKECLILMKIIPFIFVIGSMAVVYIDKLETSLKEWKWYHNLIWLFVIPMIMIFISSMISIHSKVPFFNSILNSKLIVYSMGIILILCYSILVCISYVSVSKYVCYKSNNNKSILVLTSLNILATFLSYMVFKLSVGYNNSRAKYGYILPNFQPSRNSKNTLSFWLLETIKTTYNNIINDFKCNINITE